MQNNDLWKKILGEIETEVSSANFLTLFKPTTLVSTENNIIKVSAPSIWIIDLLQKRFYKTLKKTADKHMGLNTKIEFVIKSAPSQKKTQHAPSPLFDGVGETITPRERLIRVNPEFTFKTLAVSSSNQLAYV